MRLEIDNWRWAGVPFYLRTGKHLANRVTEIAVRFKPAPATPFQDTPVEALRPNWLVLRIAPDEGISLQFDIKRPGPEMDLATVKMDFRYNDWFPKEVNVGYETLIHDVMSGDQTLFMRADMVEQTWRIVQPVLEAWGGDGAADMAAYASGSSGPDRRRAAVARKPAMARPRRSRRGAQRMTAPARISALVSDVDGSLVTDDKQLTPETIRAVARLRDAGLAFTVISSRPPRGLRDIVAALGVEAPVAGFNGGVIAGPDLAPLAEHLLAPETARRALDFLHASDLQTWVFSQQDWLVRDLAGAYVALERRTVQFAPTHVINFDPALKTCAKMVAVSADFAALDVCEAAMRESLGDEANVVRSQNYYLDITHPRANKGDGLAELARLMKTPLEEVAVIGDGANDVAMFARAGLAIAMGNAAPEVRARADFVTGSNSADGFAGAVERFVLAREAPAAREGGRR